MPGPFLSPRILRAEWVGARSLSVRFRSGHTGDLHQLYEGRRLIGVSDSPTTRRITGIATPGDWSQHYSVIAVAEADRDTDFGTRLAARPYNQVLLSWTAESFPGDAKLFRVTAGTEPGGAVSASNVLGTVPFTGDHAYSFVTPLLEGTGTWNFEVTPVDDKLASGNAGTALALSAAVKAYPPDVVPDANGRRLTLTAESATLSVAFVEA